VRPFYPTPGVAIDWTVLGLGAAVLAACLGALSVALAVRSAPHRVAAQRQRAAIGGGACAASSGLPAPTVAGIGFVLEPGAARSAVPVRSAILGAALALIVVIGTVTFGASLDTLVSPPPPLRVELELRAKCGRWLRRHPSGQGHPAPCPRSLCPGMVG
jgi:hypothetical protein